MAGLGTLILESENIAGCSSATVRDYVKRVLTSEIKDISRYALIPHMVVVTLENVVQDFGAAESAVSVCPLVGKSVCVRLAESGSALVVSGMEQFPLPWECLIDYLEVCFADGRHCVSYCTVWPDSDYALVDFLTDEWAVRKKVLDAVPHFPMGEENVGCRMSFEPYYINFHDVLFQDLGLGKEVPPYVEESGMVPSLVENVDPEKDVDGLSTHAPAPDACRAEWDGRGNDIYEDKGNDIQLDVLTWNEEVTVAHASTEENDQNDDDVHHQRVNVEHNDRDVHHQRVNVEHNDGDVHHVNVEHNDGDVHHQRANVAHEDGSHDVTSPHDHTSAVPSAVRGDTGQTWAVSVEGTSVRKETGDKRVPTSRPSTARSRKSSFSLGHFSREVTVVGIKTQQGNDGSLQRQTGLRSDTFQGCGRRGLLYRSLATPLDCRQLAEEQTSLERKLLAREKEKEQLNQIPECCNLSKEFALPKLHMKVLERKCKSTKECSMHFDSDNRKVVLVGTPEGVQKCERELDERKENIEERFVQLSPNMSQILRQEMGKAFLNEHLAELCWELREYALYVAEDDKHRLDAAVASLKDRLHHRLVEKYIGDIPGQTQNVIASQVQALFKLLVVVEPRHHSFIIEGVKDDVEMARIRLTDLLREHALFERTFEVEGEKAEYFDTFLRNQVMKVPSDVQAFEPVYDRGTFRVKYKGKLDNVRQVLQERRILEERVTVRKFSIGKEFSKRKEDVPLILAHLDDDDFRSILKTLERKHRSILKCEKKFQSQRLEENVEQAERKDAPALTGTSLVAQAGDNCEVLIKAHGNILKEQSDVLVCVEGENFDMSKTTVAQAFRKVSPLMEGELHSARNARDAASSDVIVTQNTCDDLPCRAVVHVALTRWNQDTSPRHFAQVLQQALRVSGTPEVTSIAFPPMGCGRAFSFPPAQEARIVLATMKEVLRGTDVKSLTRISLMASNRQLYSEYKRLITDFFPLKSTSHEENVKQERSNKENSWLFECTDGLTDAEITVLLQGQRSNVLVTHLKQKIQEIFLHVEQFNDKLMEDWPTCTLDNISAEASRAKVWLSRPSFKTSCFLLKGKKKSVTEVLVFIKAQSRRLAVHLPRRRIQDAPNRDTTEFVSYALSCDELFPSYWSLNSPAKVLEIKESYDPDLHEKIVDVDQQTFDCIAKLVADTWDATRFGIGSDAKRLKELNCSQLRVLKVQRIENPALFDRYHLHRIEILRRTEKNGQLYPKLESVSPFQTQPETMRLDQFLAKELLREINEHYFFHGTHAGTAGAVAKQGLDPRIANPGAMAGRGVYLAEKSTKSDQYADPRNQRTPLGTPLTLLLVRVALGNVFHVDRSHPSLQSRHGNKLLGPPCTNCQSDEPCNCKKPRYDSVLVEDTSFLFREFVVYDRAHCYPEYIVTYVRE
ncbi:uncharacterized protein LOC101854754 [Aplysia californica]|uniref:Poly [ADP-ribose] polymerase n=1 Tax=Aplysia californica TaxID=6500 RepID=A0ABM0K507_APLCA|nr:uncharacterized protein LOC101854754 [Aplysia californica]